MDFPMLSKEEMEKNLTLAADAWKNPGIDTWIALVDAFIEETFGEGSVEDEEEEAEERAKNVDEEEVITYDDFVHALVEVTWEAWQSDPDRCKSWVQVGLEGDDKTGLPPFLNMRAGSAHIQLALFLERCGEITLSQNAQALGRALLVLHMSEAYIRPGMATATFILRVWMKEEGSFEDDLLARYKHRGFGMASYGATRDRFINRIKVAKKMFKDRSCLEVLDDFMSDDKAELTLSQLRNAVGHHNLDILNGDIRIGWIEGYPEWDNGDLVTISDEQMKDFLWSMRGFVMTLMAWERMMVTVFNPPPNLENFDIKTAAEGLHMGLAFLKGQFQPWF